MRGKIRVLPSMPSVSASSSPVRLKFWGTRGSIAVPGPETLRYGGNTTCLELRADGEIIVLDAGSGIRPLGVALQKEFQQRPIKLSLLITHAHWDHIQGFPFFNPAYDPKNEIRIFGFDGAGATFREIMTEPMRSPFFPITMRELSAKMDINKLSEMKLSLGKVDVHAAFVNHPGVCAGYRIFTSGGSIAFLPDHEPYECFLHAARGKQLSPKQAKEIAAAQHAALVQFLRGSDILVLDAQYTDQEYKTHVGWGHGSISSAVSLAFEAEVQTLLLFHHDPSHDDDMVDTMVKSARELVEKSGSLLEVAGAKQGSEILLEAKKIAAA
ncbi:MAG TPA: MBL fold metallo-hydrolase [Candidatus Udaeobacter sp.]|nr:MBL fold metallo-hydrolase [Candidatus Udaeobacter sp.]